MKVIVLIQPGDRLSEAEKVQQAIQSEFPDAYVELAVETVAEDPDTRLGNYEPVKRN